MIRSSIIFLFLMLVTGCATTYLPLTQTQLRELTTCDVSLDVAKTNLKESGFDILIEKDDFFYTDWKHVKDWSGLYEDGVYIKYKVRMPKPGHIEWSEHRSVNHSDNNSVVNDFYSEPQEDSKRQEKIKELICAPADKAVKKN